MFTRIYFTFIVMAFAENGLSLPAAPQKRALDTEFGVDDGLYSHGHGDHYRGGSDSQDCDDSHGDSSEEVIYNHGNPRGHQLNDYQNGGRSFVKSSAAASASSYSEAASI